jgi:hypothetical protein
MGRLKALRQVARTAATAFIGNRRDRKVRHDQQLASLGQTAIADPVMRGHARGGKERPAEM